MHQSDPDIPLIEITVANIPSTRRLCRLALAGNEGAISAFEAVMLSAAHQGLRMTKAQLSVSTDPDVTS